MKCHSAANFMDGSGAGHTSGSLSGSGNLTTINDELKSPYMFKGFYGILMVMVGPKTGLGVGASPTIFDHFWKWRASVVETLGEILDFRDPFHSESPEAKSKAAKKRPCGCFLKLLLINLVPHHWLPLQFLRIVQKSTGYLPRKTYRNT